MKKLTKKNLEQLAETMPRISEGVQRTFIGGGDGTEYNPYTTDEFDRMCYSGHWYGGFVEGMGYVAMELNTMPSGSYTPMNGTFVTAADLLGESNSNAQNGFWTGIAEFVTGIWEGTDAVLDAINSFGGDASLADYFQQNPSGQLYAIDRIFQSNMGTEVHQVSYYDENGTLIATRTYR